jgi:hypothetical protein
MDIWRRGGGTGRFPIGRVLFPILILLMFLLQGFLPLPIWSHQQSRISAEIVESFEDGSTDVTLELRAPGYKDAAGFDAPVAGWLIEGSMEVEGLAWTSDGMLEHGLDADFQGSDSLEHLTVEDDTVRLEELPAMKEMSETNDWADGTTDGLIAGPELTLEGAPGMAFLWEQVVSNASNEQDLISMATDGEGVTHMVWEDNRKGFDIYYARSADGITYADERSLIDLGDTFVIQEMPDIALGDDDVIHVVWADEREKEEDRDIYYRRSTNGGTSFEVATRVDHGDNVSNEPAIAVDGAGNIHVVWVDTRDGNRSLYYSKNMDTEFRVSNSTIGEQLQPDIAVDSNGWVHVAWRDSRGGDLKVYHSRLDPLGSDLQDEVMISPGSLGTIQGAPTLETDDSGAVYIVWHDNRAMWYNIYLSKSTDGMDFTSPLRISPRMITAYFPDLTFKDGTLHVVWYDYRDGNSKVFYRNSTDLGDSFSDTFRVDHSNASKGRRPAISVAEDGWPRIAWVDFRQHAGGDIFATHGTFNLRENGTLDVVLDLGSRPYNFTGARWIGVLPTGGSVNILGRTSHDGQDWGAMVNLANESHNLTPERYLNVKVVLKTENTAYTPTVEMALVNYTRFAQKGTMVSSVLCTTHDINNASLDWDRIGTAGDIGFEISVDGGMSWTEVEEGKSIVFDNPGTELVYKVDLDRDVEGTPVLDRVVLNFTERSFPSDLELVIGETRVWRFTGPFSGSVTLTDLGSAVNDYLKTFDTSGDEVTIPIDVEGKSPGSLVLSHLSLDFALTPEITDHGPSSTTQVNEGEVASFWVSVSEADGRPIEYTWMLEGEVLEGEVNSTMFYTPSYEGDEERTENILVEVSNGYLTASHEWKVIVNHVNRPPVIESSTPSLDAIMVEDRKVPVQFSVDAVDPDSDFLTYKWTVDTAEVSGASGGQLILDPAEHTEGEHDIQVEVSDGTDSVTHEWTVIILPEEKDGRDDGDMTGWMLMAVLLVFMIIIGIVFIEAYRRGRGDERAQRKRFLDEEERLLEAGEELQEVEREEAMMKRGRMPELKKKIKKKKRKGPRPKRKGKVVKKRKKTKRGRS